MNHLLYFIQQKLGISVFNNISNELKTYPLEIRILIIVASAGLLFSVLTSIANYFLDLGDIMIAICLGTGVVGVIALYLAIVKRSYRVPSYLGILSLVLVVYPAMWIFNGGSHGPIMLFMLFNAVFCSALLAYLNYKIVLVLQLIVIYSLLTLEYLMPTIIVAYKNEFTRSIDIAFSFTLIFLLTFYLVVRIMSEYNSSITELEKVKKELLETNRKLTTTSETDELTGVRNRRHIMKVLNHRLLLKESEATSLIMLDIDHFKAINDTYGHSVGDEVLKKVCNVLAIHTRKTDTLARIGGEEFLIVLPGASLEDAYEKAENLRITIGNLQWRHSDMRVTISGGIYSKKREETLDDLLEQVDQRLYLSKNRGRNRISH